MTSENKLEICCYSIEEVRAAATFGADRAELCSGRMAGGLTPSAGVIEEALKIDGITVYVMIRPRPGDFTFTEDEFEVMKADIRLAKKMGTKGVAFGILDGDGNVDIKRNAELHELAKPMDVTFHRAFDMTADPFKALDDIASIGIKRILTSGQASKAMDGIGLLKKLNEYAKDKIILMAGSGVNETNMKALHDVGINEFHATAFKYIEEENFNRKIILTGFDENDGRKITSDEEKIKAMKIVILSL